MNSSGIKRGLAGSAVAALAVTGLPFLASSASAASDDELHFVSAGPTRDGITNAVGGYVTLKAKGVVSTADAQARIKAINTDLDGTPNNANQTIDVIETGIVWIADAASNPNGGLDGYDEILVPVAVDTATTGATASYALFLDDFAAPDTTGDGVVQSTEARVQVKQTTSGAPASLTLDPVTQTAPANVQSGDYVGTVKDSAGRTTQFLSTESATIDPDATTQVQKAGDAEGAADAPVTIAAADVAQRGTFSFKARSSTTTLHTIPVDGPGTADATAQLDVVTAATGITQGQVDVVTGADTREGFDDANTAAVTVRPDQSNIKLDINSLANANSTVSVTAASAAAPNNVTFGGAASKTYTVRLDAQGKGSITVAVDAASIQSGDQLAIDGSGIDIDVTYAAPAVTAATVATDAQTYLSSFGGTVNPTVTVTDQYGNPVTGVYVTVDRRNGANAADSESARVGTNAVGKASFALTDTSTGTGPKAKDDLFLTIYPGQLGTELVAAFDAADIVYSQDGRGEDFTVTADGFLPAGSAYDPNAVFARPLTDTAAAAGATTDTIDLALTGGTAGAPVTVTVSNGALLLKGAENRLSQASATDSSTVGGPAFRIVGTKSGLVDVTVTSGGRTKTFQVSVRSLAQDNQDAAGDARNISLAGPASGSGEAGEVVNFTATVTDAFGNPVRGVAANTIQTIVTGGGQVIGNSGASNSLGQIVFQVQLGEAADGDVALRVTGTGAQFGAAANRLAATDTTDTGTGLTASKASDAATVNAINIEKLEQAVEEAQAKVDAAQDAVDAANGDLSVAQAERRVAQQAVKAAKKDLRQAKKQGKGVKAAKAALADAKGDRAVANTKVKAAQGKVNRAENRLDAAQAQLEAAEQELEDAQG
ncbi:hypothetical protein [Nocardioides pyridinolyticus]